MNFLNSKLVENASYVSIPEGPLTANVYINLLKIFHIRGKCATSAKLLMAVHCSVAKT